MGLVTREQLVAEARSWVGTPVAHQGRKKGLAVDCKGLVAGVAQELGLPEGRSLAAMATGYPHGFKGRELYQGLKDTLIRVREERPGDVLAILWGREPFPRHLAIVSDQPGWIIHAYGGGVGEVSEVPLAAMRVHSRWTWPSLGEQDG